jgi:hypothetical protein
LFLKTDGAGNLSFSSDLPTTSFTGATVETSIADSDLVLIYDDSATAVRKMTKANLVAGIGASAGQVIQVVQGTSSSQTTNSTTTYADSNLSVSITPSSASNKILLMLTQKFMIATGVSDRDSNKIKLLRNSTDIWEDSNFYLQTTNVSAEISRYVSINYLDSPSTTSSITYKTQFALGSTASNKYILSNQGSTISILTALEVKG